MTTPLNFEHLLAESDTHLASYLQATEQLSHEMKGIRPSEMFFLYAAVAGLVPARIIESGRARAQSTLVLSLLFPGASIVSVELDSSSPDIAVAEERLKARDNVECRFGDARALLPALLQPGDVVLIDGPKDFRAVKLALRLLRTGKPAAVFVHDLWPGSPARSFVDRHVRGVFLSDDREWVRRYSHLDSRSRTPPHSLGARRLAYGATMGCFVPARQNYSLALARCALAQAGARAREIWRKLRRRPARVRPKDFAEIA